MSFFLHKLIIYKILLLVRLFSSIDAELRIKLDDLAIANLQRLEFYFSTERCSEFTAAKQLKAVFIVPTSFVHLNEQIGTVRIEADPIESGNSDNLNNAFKFSLETGKAIEGKSVKVRSKVRCIWVQILAIDDKISVNSSDSRRLLQLDIEKNGKQFCVDFNDVDKVFFNFLFHLYLRKERILQ